MKVILSYWWIHQLKTVATKKYIKLFFVRNIMNFEIQYQPPPHLICNIMFLPEGLKYLQTSFKFSDGFSKISKLYIPTNHNL